MSNSQASTIVVKNATKGTMVHAKVCQEGKDLCSPVAKIAIGQSHSFDLTKLGLVPGQNAVVNIKVVASLKKPRNSDPVVFQPGAGKVGYSVEGRVNTWEIVGPYAAVNA